jgi:hypothetical protein
VPADRMSGLGCTLLPGRIRGGCFDLAGDRADLDEGRAPLRPSELSTVYVICTMRQQAGGVVKEVAERRPILSVHWEDKGARDRDATGGTSQETIERRLVTDD